jgi:hypothetical protein
VLHDGRILISRGRTILPKPFLNIASLISCCDERGLLSMTFHPQFKHNGLFYVFYTDATGNVVVARYTALGGADAADPRSRRVILTIPHPNFGHYGGSIRFGPDGFLYISVGDGGTDRDIANNGQSLGTLLGKVLRIAVNRGLPYAIPASNPFINRSGARKEIWAYGLRNPWKISFDRLLGHLYITDVGHDSYEEINFQGRSSAGGQNYGWRRMEGKHCFNPTTNCFNNTLKLPLLEYPHPSGQAAFGPCSVTGGYVYRGARISSLAGWYIYADLCTGVVKGVKRMDGILKKWKILSTNKFISTFGEDDAGEVYFGHHQSPTIGSIYKIVLVK